MDHPLLIEHSEREKRAPYGEVTAENTRLTFTRHPAQTERAYVRVFFYLHICEGALHKMFRCIFILTNGVIPSKTQDVIIKTSAG